jgi:hypothetical protein
VALWQCQRTQGVLDNAEKSEGGQLGWFNPKKLLWEVISIADVRLSVLEMDSRAVYRNLVYAGHGGVTRS